jgi:hypothetical protein
LDDFIPYAFGQYKIIILFVAIGGIIPRLSEVKGEWHQSPEEGEHVGLFGGIG